MDRTEAQSRYELAQQIAVEAGRLTMKHFRTASLSVERKGDDSPLTIADQEAERYLRAAIADHFPDDAIVGEEFGVTEGTSGFRWILDPIDGTKSFICGVPLYGTMVAVDWGSPDAATNRDCVIGSVYLPGLEEGIHAMSGAGAWHFSGTKPPVAAQVSRKSELRNCRGLPPRKSKLLPSGMMPRRGRRLPMPCGSDAHGATSTGICCWQPDRSM